MAKASFFPVNRDRDLVSDRGSSKFIELCNRKQHHGGEERSHHGRSNPAHHGPNYFCIPLSLTLRLDSHFFPWRFDDPLSSLVTSIHRSHSLLRGSEIENYGSIFWDAELGSIPMHTGHVGCVMRYALHSHVQSDWQIGYFP